nr:TIGR04283 family arsenosugar biosynthesis glycosyltransferase [Litorivivens lipolytica]
MPVLNEAQQLASMRPWSKGAGDVEWIVVDGGSRDNSVALAMKTGAKVIESVAGRARQMNAGAAVAMGDYLLFLHADTVLPDNLDQFLATLKAKKPTWGFFRVCLQPSGGLLNIVAGAMNLRSRLTRVATGDQAQFIRRADFERMKGFADIPLMEDVEISKRLRRQVRPMIWAQPVITSSRRWQKHGVLKTILLMWSLRLQYVLGVSPEILHKRYSGESVDAQ